MLERKVLSFMDTKYILENELVQATINTLGAELTSFKLKGDGTEYIWQADPKFWGRHAPILFPIVGRLKDNTYRIKDRTYFMTQHGFARDLPFELISSGDDYFSFGLTSNEETLAKYPFEFELVVSYKLEGTSLQVTYGVRNAGSETMYFSIGAHPGFNWPLRPDQETAEDYVVEFSSPETVDLLLIEDGLISNEGKPFLKNESSFPLSEDLFAKDALVFQGLQSEKLALRSLKTDKFVEMEIEGFPYLGIWSQRGSAPFVCFEPWFGLADEVDSDYDFTTKRGIQKLEVNGEFACTYTITIG